MKDDSFIYALVTGQDFLLFLITFFLFQTLTLVSPSSKRDFADTSYVVCGASRVNTSFADTSYVVCEASRVNTSFADISYVVCGASRVNTGFASSWTLVFI